MNLHLKLNKLCAATLAAIMGFSALTQAETKELVVEGIKVTSVKYEVTKRTCGVYYWNPGDANQDSKIETCGDLPYNPCSVSSGQRELTQFVLSGGTCKVVRPKCDGLFPKIPNCIP